MAEGIGCDLIASRRSREDELAREWSMVVFEAVTRYLNGVTTDTTVHDFPTEEGAGAHCQVSVSSSLWHSLGDK